MPVNILMPALSPTMEKGNLAKWLKKEGDTVKTGDVIAEIETDKATMEYEAIEDGTLAKIVVPEGTNDVPVNQLIAVLASEGEDVKAAAAAAAKASSATEATPKPAQPTVPSSGKETKAPPPPTAPPQPPPSAQRRDGGEAVRTNGKGVGPSRKLRLHLSPRCGHLARRVHGSALSRREFRWAVGGPASVK